MVSPGQECPEFPHFGAHYPDACCINGYLWDLDKYDADAGGLYGGGDDPCPFCNTEEYIEWLPEDWTDEEVEKHLNFLKEKHLSTIKPK